MGRARTHLPHLSKWPDLWLCFALESRPDLESFESLLAAFGRGSGSWKIPDLAARRPRPFISRWSFLIRA